MARYSILITHSPGEISHTIAAQRFARQVAGAGHMLSNIFFYGNGTYHANAFMQIPSDEHQSYSEWCDISRDARCPLMVCVTAAVKRGLLCATEAQDAGVTAVTLQAPFEQVGLGEFFTQLHDCDHLVQF